MLLDKPRFSYDGSYITESLSFRRVIEISRDEAVRLIKNAFKEPEHGWDTWSFVNKMFTFVPTSDHDFNWEDYQERRASGLERSWTDPDWVTYQAKPDMVGVYNHDGCFYIMQYIGEESK